MIFSRVSSSASNTVNPILTVFEKDDGAFVPIQAVICGQDDRRIRSLPGRLPKSNSALPLGKGAVIKSDNRDTAIRLDMASSHPWIAGAGDYIFCNTCKASTGVNFLRL